MKTIRKVLILVLSAVLLLSLTSSLSFASEEEPGVRFNHGRLLVSSEEGGDTIEMTVGETANLSISPYMHIQYLGCDKGYCPDYCGPGCFIKGKGCSCFIEPKTRTAAVTVTVGDKNIVQAGEASANGDIGSDIGNVISGSVPITGAAVGETKVTVTAKLRDWIPATGEFTIRVKETPKDAANDFYTYTYDTTTHGYKVGLSDAFRAALDQGDQGSFTGAAGSGSETINWRAGEALPDPAPNGQYNGTPVSSLSGLFAGCTAASLDLSKFTTDNVASTAGMFNRCSSLQELDLSKFNTEKVKNLAGMFDGCTALETVDVSEFNTAKVTDMSCLFRNCSALTGLDLKSFDIARTTNFENMFSGTCSASSAAVTVTGLAKTRAICKTFSDAKLTGIDAAVLNFKTPTYTVTLVSAGGTGTNLTSYIADIGATLPSDWTREGWTFDGWYADGAFSGSPIGRITRDDAGDKTFYAKWTPLTYQITYHGVEDADNSMNATAYTPEENVRLQAPRRTGYLFDGWYEHADFSGSRVTAIGKNSIGDRTYYAKWKTATYQITYVLNGGRNAESNPASYRAGDAAIRLANPVRKGYAFGGWYDQRGRKVTAIAKGSTGNLRLTARWYRNPAVPKVKVKAGSKKFTVKYGKVSGAVKYQVQYRRSGAKAWTTKTVSRTSLTVKKLKKKSRYSVRVRALGKYGSRSSYSGIKTVKIK
ncbi:MAG: InlB B-repeat-containing protein [Anaerovoracaceae bacterium]|jgi:uncharacterized repeat protein (TIGR02543 family)